MTTAIRITIQRLPKGRGWRVAKFYPKAKGIKRHGWVYNDHADIDVLVPHALRGLAEQLIKRGKGRLLKARP